jgi:hypothetical protein
VSISSVVATAELGGAGRCSMNDMESGADIMYDRLAEILSA